MNRINELIEKRKKELQEPIIIDPGYEMCKDFADNNQIFKFEDFAKIDIWEFLKCKAYLSIDDITLEQSIDLVEVIKNEFSNLDYELISDLMEVYIYAKDDGMINNIIQYLKEENIIKEKLLLKNIYPDDPLARKVYTRIKGFIKNNNNKNIIKLFEYIEEFNENQLWVIVELYSTYLAINFALKESERILSNLDFNVRKRDAKKVLGDTLKDNFKTSMVTKEAKQIQDYVLEYESNLRKKERDRNNEIAGLDRATNLLEKASQNQEITNAREIVKYIKDLDIKFAVLVYIRGFNKPYHLKLEEELKSLNQNSEANYKALLNDYKITCDNDCVKSIMHNSIEDIKEMIIILRRFNIDDNNILKILSNSNYDIVSIIRDYLDKGYLSLEIIYSNIDLFYINNDKLQVLNDNIDILQKYNLNPAIFKNSFSILTIDSEISNLEKNINILSDYNLLKNIRNSNDYSFMNDEELYLKIDKLLELGYEEFLEENLGLLNSNNIKRLEVLKVMNMECTDKYELEFVLSDDNQFFIKDEDLDSYIPNVIPYKNYIKLDDNFSLDGYRNTTRTYSFNGVLISIPKVERLINEGIGLEEALLNNTNLDEEDYNRFLESINMNDTSKIIS